MTKRDWEEIIKYGAYCQELDWFAIDNSGNLGLFSANTNAPIPENVKQSYENYIALHQIISLLPKSSLYTLETLVAGNFSFWISYAEKGLFTFDFQDSSRKIQKGQYDLIAKPISPVNFNSVIIPPQILTTIFRIDCNFFDGDVNSNLI
jgi:hypothetical protein